MHCCCLEFDGNISNYVKRICNFGSNQRPRQYSMCVCSACTPVCSEQEVIPELCLEKECKSPVADSFCQVLPLPSLVNLKFSKKMYERKNQIKSNLNGSLPPKKAIYVYLYLCL